MRFILQLFVPGLLAVLALAGTTFSQAPAPLAPVAPAALFPPVGSEQTHQAEGPIPFLSASSPNPPPTTEAAKATPDQMTQELQQAVALAAQADKPDDTLKKKVDLLQKQIEVQQKIIQLLVDQMKKSAAGGPAVEDLQGKVATLEARSKQAAQRDLNIEQAVDNLTEHIDAEERNGPRLPAALKELFLASRNNETPLSIYGSFVENFTQQSGHNGVFTTPDFAPYFLLQLNEQFLLTANVDITNAGVSLGEAQIDWLVTDWMTVVLGRFLTPIGFFNERLNHEWINRLPDEPLMFRQVSPLISTDGLMLRGAAYVCCSPVKLEYMLYAGNGLQAAAPPATYTAAVDLGNITGGPDETNLHAMGGRIGFWIPEWGLTGGLSGYINGRYSAAAVDQFNLWQVDLSYRKGNWDLRFECADTHQQAVSYIGNDVRRRGFYAQAAYRPYHLEHCLLRNFEVAVRYSKVWFHGIDPTMIDPTAFGSPVDIPVDRDQWTVGLNYYFYPSMALRLAYEYNHELNNFNLHDSFFLGQFVWAF
jgi:hypothetical protein